LIVHKVSVQKLQQPAAVTDTETRHDVTTSSPMRNDGLFCRTLVHCSNEPDSKTLGFDTELTSDNCKLHQTQTETCNCFYRPYSAAPFPTYQSLICQ